MNTTSFDQDASGNITRKGTVHYRWDALNRLVHADDGGTLLADYQYDGDNLRLQKTTSAGIITYL